MKRWDEFLWKEISMWIERLMGLEGLHLRWSLKFIEVVSLLEVEIGDEYSSEAATGGVL